MKFHKSFFIPLVATSLVATLASAQTEDEKVEDILIQKTKSSLEKSNIAQSQAFKDVSLYTLPPTTIIGGNGGDTGGKGSAGSHDTEGYTSAGSDGYETNGGNGGWAKGIISNLTLTSNLTQNITGGNGGNGGNGGGGGNGGDAFGIDAESNSNITLNLSDSTLTQIITGENGVDGGNGGNGGWGGHAYGIYGKSNSNIILNLSDSTLTQTIIGGRGGNAYGIDISGDFVLNGTLTQSLSLNENANENTTIFGVYSFSRAILRTHNGDINSPSSTRGNLLIESINTLGKGKAYVVACSNGNAPLSIGDGFSISYGTPSDEIAKMKYTFYNGGEASYSNYDFGTNTTSYSYATEAGELSAGTILNSSANFAGILTQNIYAQNGGKAYGIYVDNSSATPSVLTIKSSRFSAPTSKILFKLTGDSSSEVSGIYVSKDFIIDNQVGADALAFEIGNVTTKKATGIELLGNLTLKGNDLTFKSIQGDNAYGIYAVKDSSIGFDKTNSSTFDLNVGSNSTGNATGIAITDGATLTFNPDGTALTQSLNIQGNNAKGIDLQGTSTLTLGSDLALTSIQGATSAYGIYAKANAEIKSGDNAFRKIILSNLSSTPTSYAIYAQGASLSFDKAGVVVGSSDASTFTGIEDKIGAKFELGEQTIFRNITGSETVAGLILHDSSKLGKDTQALSGNTSISLDSQSLILENISAGNAGSEYAIKGGGDIALSNNSKMFISLGDADGINIPTTSVIFSQDGARNISLDASTLALNLLSAGTKLSDNGINLSLKNGSKLLIGGDKDSNGANALTIESLSAQGNGNIVSLASSNLSYASSEITPTISSRTTYKTLTIGNKDGSNGAKGLGGNGITFELYANKNGADKIYVEKVDNTTSTKLNHSIALKFVTNELLEIQENGFAKDVVLARVASSEKDKVSFGDSVTGSTTALTAYSAFAKTNFALLNADGEEGGEQYNYYYIAKADNGGGGKPPVDPDIPQTDPIQPYYSTALNAHFDLYQLYSANLNSLNKRMGELRDTQNGEGVWVRAFNGQNRLDFAQGNTINYTTIQAGFDEVLHTKEAKTYFGVAFGASFSKNYENVTEKALASVINSSSSYGLDLGIYASHIMDNGFYSDSIVKLTHLSNQLGTTGAENYDLNALGVSLSQEVGYRASLPLGFYIDPQAELSYAYFDKTNKQGLVQIHGSESLATLQEGIHTLRTRVGVNWGFDFKDFFESDSKANAKLYVGTYYTYDYIDGGKVSYILNGVNNKTISPYQSTGRFVLNVGTNIAFKDDTRLYVDLERSFGGKMTTEYQVNLGVRVSLGEKTETRQISQTPKKQVK